MATWRYSSARTNGVTTMRSRWRNIGGRRGKRNADRLFRQAGSCCLASRLTGDTANNEFGNCVCRRTKQGKAATVVVASHHGEVAVLCSGYKPRRRQRLLWRDVGAVRRPAGHRPTGVEDEVTGSVYALSRNGWPLSRRGDGNETPTSRSIQGHRKRMVRMTQARGSKPFTIELFLGRHNIHTGYVF